MIGHASNNVSALLQSLNIFLHLLLSEAVKFISYKKYFFEYIATKNFEFSLTVIYLQIITGHASNNFALLLQLIKFFLYLLWLEATKFTSNFELSQIFLGTIGHASYNFSVFLCSLKIVFRLTTIRSYKVHILSKKKA